MIVIGPPQDAVGGMATVVDQMMSLNFEERYTLRLLPMTESPCEREPIVARLGRHWRALAQLGTAIRRHGARVVHIHTCSGFSFYRSVLDMLAAKGLGCRVILHIHGARFDEFVATEPPWRRRLIARALASADRVIALSQGWRSKLRSISPRAQVVVIENAVDVPATLPPNGHNGTCRFVLLARMDTWKGVDDLLDASARLRSHGIAMKLTMAGPAGTAGDAPTLRHKIVARDLGGAVRYVGPVHGAAKTELLNSADVYVQPSHHEGMPIAMLEALAHGLPIVATRVGAVEEVLSGTGAGVVIPPRRPDLLADAMQAVAFDRVRRRQMSLSARNLSRHRFSLARLGDDLRVVYDGLMSLPANGAV